MTPITLDMIAFFIMGFAIGAAFVIVLTYPR